MLGNVFMECLILSGKKNIKNNYFSLSLGKSSTKLQGLWLISNWYFKIPSHASVTPPDEPGNEKIDTIITTGGTGLTGRDITPEALEEIADKHIPGFGELFRNISLKTVGTSAIQSRACAVLANGKYIFALPGSSGGVTDAWDGILKYQLDINHKPCNFVELFPRLKEK